MGIFNKIRLPLLWNRLRGRWGELCPVAKRPPGQCRFLYPLSDLEILSDSEIILDARRAAVLAVCCRLL
jgi:hypothetical protein